MIDTKSTVESAMQAASTMEYFAGQIRSIAKCIEETGDLSRSGDVINAIVNCFINLRMDRFAFRPMLEYEREIERLKQAKD